MTKALTIPRHFTGAGRSPFDEIRWRKHGPWEAPEGWSDNAIEIAATKYFRRGETSVRQLFGRIVRTVREAGEWQGYFQGDQAAAFEDELAHVLLHQMASFNSPVYFNVGLFARYGYGGSGENFVVDRRTGEARPTTTAFVHPQASACFIQSVSDDLLGIFDLLKSEAKLFKHGSGTGTNFSSLRARGEKLEGGGASTGVISYLEIFDKAAQAIKSGGTSRRAAKMVVLDVDHPEIVEFIRWKMLEERKARVLLAAGYSGGMEGEAFSTVSGQNSNNSVRVTDAFLRRAERKETWTLRARKGGATVREIPADHLLREMARAAWECADPGLQFADTIARAHLCPASGPIRASNPCSEYLFLDDSACNLASLNLVKFLTRDDVDWAAFAQTVRVMLLAQEILVDYASYPTAEIARNSHAFRPLGLGFANLGAALMRQGWAYGAPEAERFTRRITAALHALALETSQKLAADHGAFRGWAANREPALAVLQNHARAAGDLDLWIQRLFTDVLREAERTGLRNAQVTLIAPTGTIGLLMDCDTLGIEPDFSLRKRKTLAGGGEMILRNLSVAAALARLGYTDAQIRDIEAHLARTGGVVGASALAREHEEVFDTAVPPVGHAHRRISPEAHLMQMAAAQPFLSGAISKTVNLPTSATVEDVERLFLEGWRRGLKALAIYRDGSKALQPLCAEC